MHCKRSLLYSQFHRVRRICSHIEDFDTNSLLIASHFRCRGYPDDIIENAIIRARRMDRTQLLSPPIKESTDNTENLVLIDTYHPGGSPLKDILDDHLSILGRNQNTASLHTKKIIFGKRHNTSLRDLLVQARLPTPKLHPKPLSRQKVKPLHLCISKSKCRYCLVIDHSGVIFFHASSRRYCSKIHTSCHSNNLIYCISCKTFQKCT